MPCSAASSRMLRHIGNVVPLHRNPNATSDSFRESAGFPAVLHLAAAHLALRHAAAGTVRAWCLGLVGRYNVAHFHRFLIANDGKFDLLTNLVAEEMQFEFIG